MEFVLNPPVAANHLGNSLCAIQTSLLRPNKEVVMPLISAHLLAVAPGYVRCMKRGNLTSLRPQLRDVCGGGAQPQISPDYVTTFFSSVRLSGSSFGREEKKRRSLFSVSR